MVEFFDINYSLLEVDERADILAQYSKLINYFDPSVRFELVLFNRQVNEQMLTEQFDIPWQEDDFNDIREEYTEMLKKQAAKGNNGIIKSKYLLFGVESNGYKEAKSRLNNIEKDVIRNLNNIGTLARGLDGKERLRIPVSYTHLSIGVLALDAVIGGMIGVIVLAIKIIAIIREVINIIMELAGTRISC